MPTQTTDLFLLAPFRDGSTAADESTPDAAAAR
jgi:hypothetical protein